LLRDQSLMAFCQNSLRLDHVTFKFHSAWLGTHQLAYPQTDPHDPLLDDV
jgi:hypothetical protein